MNRLHHFLFAKTQYNIQTPFMYDLYENVLAPKLDKPTMARMGIGRRDRYGQLRYKLADHYGATETGAEPTLDGADTVLATRNDGLIGMVRQPHGNRSSEKQWSRLVKEHEVTLSVDLYDIGLVFTSKRLSKQHILFREFL